MTPEVLRSFIAGAETLDVEFKGEEARALSEGDLVEAVVCLANRPGNTPGWLLVGAEDDGRITRAEAPGPCEVSPDQPYRLLRRLTESGRLTRHGTKKGAWYARRA